MIDWWGVIANAIWILGCSLALAALSYAYWGAYVCRSRLRMLLRRPKMQLAIDWAGMLFCLGMLLTSASRLAVVGWLILVVLFCVQIWRNRRVVESADQTRFEM